jgi:hypothetical protein
MTVELVAWAIILFVIGIFMKIAERRRNAQRRYIDSDGKSWEIFTPGPDLGPDAGGVDISSGGHAGDGGGHGGGDAGGH